MFAQTEGRLSVIAFIYDQTKSFGFSQTGEK
jgi:hypothetical protein